MFLNKAPPIIRGSYLSQSQSEDRSIPSTPTTLRMPESYSHGRASSERHKARRSRDSENIETSFSGSSYSNSDEENADAHSAHTCSDSYGSEDEDGNGEDEDDDNASVLTGTFGSRLKRFCWALCCAGSDCCRCTLFKCSKCSCCRSRIKGEGINELGEGEFGGVEIDNGVLMHENDSGANAEKPGNCCSNWLKQTWSRWTTLKKAVCDYLEFAENGKILGLSL